MELERRRNIVTGVDIGGTHITACLVDLDELTIIEETEVRGHIDSSAGADTIISAWAAVIKEANNKKQHTVGRIGIAMPGPFDYENGISLIKGLAKYESLYGLNVKEKLAQALGITTDEIRMVNDATAYLAGEHQFGSGRGSESILGITLGTGLGSAWYMQQQMNDGDLYYYPFKEGVAEDYVSARWLINAYHERTGELLPGVQHISERARNNDKIALELFNSFGRSLAEIIVSRFHPELPERVVLGGNIARSADIFLPACKQVLVAAEFNVHFVLASLGEAAALTGAACLWKDE